MYSKLIDLADQIIHNIRCQSYHEASLKIPQLTSSIEASSILSNSLTDSNNDFYYIFSCISEALINKDYILLADTLEESFIPYIKTLLTYPDPFIFQNYSIEPSSSGFLTIKHLPSNTYLHSNCNPMDEARSLIKFYFDESKHSYVIFGLGLGYHVKALYDYSIGAINIKVFESDKNLIDFVKANDQFNLFSNKTINIIHDPIGKQFLKDLSDETTGLLMHYPSILKIDNDELKLQIKRFYTSWNSYYQWKRIININFSKNILNCPQNILCEKNNFQNKSIYIVGGGPSVDSNIELLKNLDKDDSIIICATTVLKKLLSLEITPHYTIVMDAQKRTYGHMNGIEECNIPIIIDSAAYWEFGENHKGKKYLALQRGYKPAEILAKENNYPLFDTSGTVITLALDIAIQFNANNIYFIGVDMAFPKGKTHANGSMDEKELNTSSLNPIEDVNGNIVYTDELMLGYLNSIENKILSHPEINYYNLSPNGARIKGTRHPKI